MQQVTKEDIKVGRFYKIIFNGFYTKESDLCVANIDRKNNLQFVVIIQDVDTEKEKIPDGVYTPFYNDDIFGDDAFIVVEISPKAMAKYLEKT